MKAIIQSNLSRVNLQEGDTILIKENNSDVKVVFPYCDGERDILAIDKKGEFLYLPSSDDSLHLISDVYNFNDFDKINKFFRDGDFITFIINYENHKKQAVIYILQLHEIFSNNDNYDIYCYGIYCSSKESIDFSTDYVLCLSRNDFNDYNTNLKMRPSTPDEIEIYKVYESTHNK